MNFQTPSDAIYRALAALLRVPLDAAGDPQRCAIVSTFSTRDVRDLGFAGFIAYGAHGVAGATASALPSLPPPIYFNEQVVPDPAQRRSSQDGGVIWTGVPTGTYRITAHHPTARFASFVATCRPGRIVNANPPWGLHELGLANPARVSATWTRRGGVAVLGSLRLRALPGAGGRGGALHRPGLPVPHADLAGVRPRARRRRDAQPAGATAAGRPGALRAGLRAPLRRHARAVGRPAPRRSARDDAVRAARGARGAARLLTRRRSRRPSAQGPDGYVPAMHTAPTSDVWWKNAVVYCLDVETFADADSDGCGDLAGLVDRIDHVASLGATCVWLMPLYPTPNRDDGYDITDYLGVDPRLGDLGDLVEAIRHAEDRGLRVLADLVVNHTSDEHPWFRAARADRRSPYRDFYVWTDDPSREEGTSEDNWAWDDEAGQFYMHQFAPFQPDLNIANPAVRDQIVKTVGFWLKLGVSGFRMDAVPFLVQEIDARGDEEAGAGKRWLHALREYAMRRRGDAMLMGECNVAMEDVPSFFEDHGDALHLQLAFLINQRLWLGLARGEAAPLEELIRELPVPPRDCG